MDVRTSRGGPHERVGSPVVAHHWGDSEPSEAARKYHEAAISRRGLVIRALRLVKLGLALDCRSALRIVKGIEPRPFADWRAADERWRARLPESRAMLRENGLLRERVKV